MVSRHIFVADTAFAAYGDTYRALRAMPVLAICVALIILAIESGQDLIPRRIWDTELPGTALGLAVDIARGVCLAPCMIAVHRFVILGEVTRGYIVDPFAPRFFRFVGWLIAFSLLMSVVFAVPDLSATGLSTVTMLALLLAGVAAIIVLAFRLSVLFPALAVDAKRASAANALADTKGHLFQIFLVFALTLLPVAVVAIVVTFMLGSSVGKPGSSAAIAHLVAGAVIQTVTIPLCVAAASRLYQTIGNHLGPPA
ncbi:MAG: hypothetical protein ACXWJW_08855 [Xanthobacteraceae bacterium]